MSQSDFVKSTAYLIHCWHWLTNWAIFHKFKCTLKTAGMQPYLNPMLQAEDQNRWTSVACVAAGPRTRLNWASATQARNSVTFKVTVNPLLSPPLSNKPPLFRGGKLISLPSLSSPHPHPLHPYSSQTINMYLTLMVYSGWKFILFLVFGRMTSYFMCLTFQLSLCSCSLWRIVTIFLLLEKAV